MSLTTTILLPTALRVYTLSRLYTIGGRPEHSETTIQCVAGMPSVVTPIVTFLIQGQLTIITSTALLYIFYAIGPLQSVSNITRDVSTIMWEAPFSLNLTNADPDIVYCVEVYNITCRKRDLIISDCNVTEPSYTSDDIALHGYIYEYTVTPRSNVKGASNGIRKNASGKHLTCDHYS